MEVDYPRACADADALAVTLFLSRTDIRMPDPVLFHSPFSRFFLSPSFLHFSFFFSSSQTRPRKNFIPLTRWLRRYVANYRNPLRHFSLSLSLSFAHSLSGKYVPRCSKITFYRLLSDEAFGNSIGACVHEMSAVFIIETCIIETLRFASVMHTIFNYNIYLLSG